MTRRQVEVLRMVREETDKGCPWINLGLSKGAEAKITWDELNWVSEFEKQALLTRIDAALLVAFAVDSKRAMEGASLEGGDVPAATCEHHEPRCTR